MGAHDLLAEGRLLRRIHPDGGLGHWLYGADGEDLHLVGPSGRAMGEISPRRLCPLDLGVFRLISSTLRLVNTGNCSGIYLRRLERVSLHS